METQPCGGSGCKGNCHCRPTCPRWTPTTDQIRILKELYYNNGVRSPTAEQIQKISARLRQYGKIEGKNVFYWFQNYKARERLKKKIEAGDSTRPASYTVYTVGQMGDPGFGPVIMEKSFRDCSISSTGSSVVAVSAGGQNSTSSNIFFGQKNPVENTNKKEEEEENGLGIEIETLPLFPMHGEENNSNSYYSGRYGYSDGSSTTFSSSASLELSLNSYTSRSSAGSCEHICPSFITSYPKYH